MADVRFESNAKEVIEKFRRMSKSAEREGISFVNDSANKVVSLVKPLTPIKSGDLRRGYRVVKARKVGNRIIGGIANNEHYFKYVNKGHRTRGGGFVKGRFMLQRGTKAAHMTYIPRRFKQMAIRVLKASD